MNHIDRAIDELRKIIDVPDAEDRRPLCLDWCHRHLFKLSSTSTVSAKHLETGQVDIPDFEKRRRYGTICDELRGSKNIAVEYERPYLYGKEFVTELWVLK